jgi:tetratricopeptide (TPR) repeat protein
MGRIYKDAGNQHNALKYLEKKISLLAPDWEKNTARAAERSIVLNQAGALAFSLGDYHKALDYFINSFQIAEKLKNKTGMVKNAINLSQIILAHRKELSNIILKSIPRVSAALAAIGSDPHYLQQRITLKNALALLWYYSPPLTTQFGSDTDQIEKSLWELKREALPSAMLQEALELTDKIADKKTMALQKTTLLANLALITSPGAKSADYRQQALHIARQNRLDNILWHLMLDKALSENNFSLLAESAKILEAIPHPKFKNFPGDRKRMEDLYGSLILHRAKEEDWAAAFSLSERYHTQIYLRTSEQGEISSLPAQSDITQAQQSLEPNDLLVKYEQVKGETFWWRVDKNSFAGGKLPSSAQPLLSASQEEDTEKFLEPIALSGIRRLYLIVSPPLDALSWEAAIMNRQPLIRQVALVRLSGLRHFLDAYQARNLTPLKLFLAEKEKKLDITNIFIDTDAWAKEKDFIAQADHWSLLHLNLPMEDDYPPPRWILPTRLNIGNRLSPADFSKGKTGKQLVVFFPRSHPVAARTARDLATAGFPTALAYYGPQKTKKTFFQTFYRYLAQSTPAKALRSTLIDLEGNYPNAWACASLYGFGGMNQVEQQQFAKQRLSANLKKGIAAFRGKDWDRATGYLEEVLVMMEVLKTVKNRDKIYRALVDSFFSLKNYPAAIDNQKKLIAYYKKQKEPDWEVLADAHYQLGVLYSRMEKYENATNELSAALKIYREYQMTDKLARGYGTLGVIEESASDYDRALKHFEAALQQNKELEDIQGVGRQMRRLGRIYYLRLNNYAQTESMFQSAREIFRRDGNKQQVVETTLELGLVRERMADFQGALAFYKEGYDLAKSVDNNLLLSKAAVNMANIAWFQGDYQTAFTRQRKGLSLAEKVNDLRQQQIAHNLAGLIYWTLNDHEKALKYLHQALDLAKTIGSKIDIASAYNNIGLVHREKKDYLMAIEHFQNALAIDQSIGSRWGEGYDYRNLGIAYLRQQNFVEAKKNLAAAIRISGEISNHINRVKAILEMGNLAYATGDYPTSRRYLEEAAQLSEKLVMPEVHWRSLMKLGELAEVEEKPELALNFYSQAIKVVEQMRATIKIEEFKNGFLSNKTDLYDKMILLLIRLGKTEEAFNMSEHSRARSFIDILGNRQIIFKDNVSQELFDRRRSLKNRILAVEKALSAKEEKPQQLTKELIDLHHQYEELLIEIKQQDPQLSAFVTVDPLTYQDIRFILEENVALLEYYSTKDLLLIWVVKKNSIKVHQIRVDSIRLQAVIAKPGSLSKTILRSLSTSHRTRGKGYRESSNSGNRPSRPLTLPGFCFTLGQQKLPDGKVSPILCPQCQCIEIRFP